MSTVTDGTDKNAPRVDKWLAALGIVFALFLVVEVALLIITLRSRDLTEQVFRFPLQEVQSRVEGSTAPSVRLPIDNGTVDVQVLAEKCNLTEKTITTQTRVSWASLDPRGTSIEDWSGIQDILPGCNKYTFFNTVPALVGARTLQLIEQFPSLDCVTWVVVGVETPLNTKQSPERWFTEEFCIYPPIAPAPTI